MLARANRDQYGEGGKKVMVNERKRGKAAASKHPFALTPIPNIGCTAFTMVRSVYVEDFGTAEDTKRTDHVDGLSQKRRN